MDEQADDQPGSPLKLPARSWRAVLRRTAKELLDDELADRAAALTYYGVLPYVEPRDTRKWPARLRASRGK